VTAKLLIAQLSACLWLVAAPAYADTLIQYEVEDSRGITAQPVIVKDGTILVKSAGGDPALDILYERDQEQVLVIDHHKHRYTPITDERVGQIARQAEDIRPLVEGIGAQLRKLSPKQREKWEKMLGGVSIDELDQAKRLAKTVKVTKTGVGKRIAGIGCEQMRVVKGGSPSAEFCFADPAALKMPESDSATLRSLIGFTRRLAAHAQGLGAQFGVYLPLDSAVSVPGVPVEIRDLSGKHPVVVTLTKVSESARPPEFFSIPDGYQRKQLNLW
jgi:hypothetical protein